ncbi:MAG: hypothetical protein ACR2L9_11100 [Solirubrobacteraceae bacterium]
MSATGETMNTPPAHRTLIVANLTAATPFLLQEVKRRAEERPTAFSLLIPNVDLRRTSDWSLEVALKMLSKAAGSPVKGLAGASDDAFESISQTVSEGTYDEILISTLPKRTSEWLRRDLPDRVEKLGVPVIVITPPEEPGALKQLVDQFSARN